MRTTSPTYKTLLESGVVSKPYASQIASGRRTPGLKKAIAIYLATGLKLGPIKGASAKAIATMGRAIEEVAA